jgi:phosphosulfolactate phosphohydrolase-like enzyme
MQQFAVILSYDAAESMSIEDTLFMGIISQLQQQMIDAQSEMVNIMGELAVYNSQQHQLQQEIRENERCKMNFIGPIQVNKTL